MTRFGNTYLFYLAPIFFEAFYLMTKDHLFHVSLQGKFRFLEFLLHYCPDFLSSELLICHFISPFKKPLRHLLINSNL